MNGLRISTWVDKGAGVEELRFGMKIENNEDLFSPRQLLILQTVFDSFKRMHPQFPAITVEQEPL